MTTLDRLVAIAASIAPAGARVGPRSTFACMALDSLECVELAVAIEDAFDVEISCAERVEAQSLADLALLVDAKIRTELPLAA